MERIEKPQDDVANVFASCAAGRSDPSLVSRLTGVAPAVVASAKQYEALAKVGRAYMFPRQSVIGNVSGSEISALYADKMVSGPARAVYDRIKMSARYGFCPLCGHGRVETLDHYLPKSVYPVLAVTPTNLVPACSDCNKRKRDEVATKEEEQTFHPYFDNFGTGRWLHAKVVQGAVPVVTFFADPPLTWQPVHRARTIHHFDSYALASLYASNAAAELVGVRDVYLVTLMDSGPVALRDELRLRANSWARAMENSWRAAVYHALADSDWFCNIGLQLVP